MKFLTLILLSAMLLAFGCASAGGEQQGNKTGDTTMANNTATAKTVQKGDTVSVNYIGKLENGSLFDTSIEAEAKKGGLPLRQSYEPLEFEVGAGQMIAGFDAAVVGMKVGDEKTVTIPAAQAYGEKSDQYIMSVPVANIGGGANISVGSVLFTQTGAKGTVLSITNGTAKIDFNHELAGKPLVFTIKMVSIKKK